MSKVTFNNKKKLFYNSLKADVDNYFSQQHIKKTGDLRLYSKAIILFTISISLYLTLLLVPMPMVWGIIASLFFGFTLASVGFNVMHDACHGAYSSKNWVNTTLGLTLNALGGNAFIWKFKHNIIHHTYVNVDGIDDDIAKSPIMRQCSTQKWVPAHRFQHIYVVLVYAISTFAWIFLMDFTKYFKGKVASTPMQKMSKKEHFIFWTSKAFYVLFYILIPVYFVGWQAWAIGFTFMHVAMGLTLALVFQLAHVVEHAEFETAGVEPKMIENEWAAHQVISSCNFAPRNLLVNWVVGGLNYQVEHHLFPRISHIHYRAISNIVRKNCEQFNLPYNQYPTMWQAIVSHFRMMKELGKKPPALVPAMVHVN